MSLLRGLADDLPLNEWLNEHIWPAETRWVNEEFVHDGTQLAMAEMLRSGTTCFNDMYFFPDVTARAAVSCGMRSCVGLIVLDFPTVWANDANEYISRGLAVHDHYRGDPLIRTVFAPHAPYTVSDAPLQHIRVLADELDLGIHMHVHETAEEVDKAEDLTGKRPLARLHELGLVAPDMIAVHMTQLSAAEIDTFAAAGGHVVHCPESNLKLASGFCPAQALLAAGVNVALGTDGAASNNDLDMLGEMRSAALLGKAVSNDASALPAHTALRMATLNGARALGLGEQTGSLVKGKWADITAINLDTLETLPLYDPVSQLVYASGREQVTDVWVAGQQLLRDRRLTTLDGNDIVERARHWQTRIGTQA
jgi:5-methylthioadenosine/S-adenosylhomocysteine deaminase